MGFHPRAAVESWVITSEAQREEFEASWWN